MAVTCFRMNSARYGLPLLFCASLAAAGLHGCWRMPTLADAHDFILQLPEKKLRRPPWQTLVDLLLSAVATRQHHLPSILTVRLETELPRLAHATGSDLPPKNRRRRV